MMDTALVEQRFDHAAAGLALDMLIDGRAVPAADGAVFESVNPYTERSWVALPEATSEDVARAVGAAREALEHGPWARMSAAERGRAVHRIGELVRDHAETLARMESLDTGKPIAETRKQAAFAAAVFEYYGGLSDKELGRVVPVDDTGIFDYVIYEPLGVCAFLLAWNSPMQLLANKLPAALAAGNAVVVRPSEMAPASVAYLAALINDEQILPAGVLNVVTGTSIERAKELVASPGVDLVSFTGGTETGREIGMAAADSMSRSVLELGGKSPNIVFADCRDLERTIEGVVRGIFSASGQSCVAGSRLLLEASIADQALDALMRRVGALELGDPLSADTEMGPLANRRQYERVRASIHRAMDDGARLEGPEHWHRSLAVLSGLFVPPTVFTHAHGESALMLEEIFGPVLAVATFETEDDAVALANATKYGLAAGVWTDNLSRALRLVPRLEAGYVWVNTYRRSFASTPFGGVKQSGMGRERGLDGFHEFSRVKNVMIDYSTEAEGT